MLTAPLEVDKDAGQVILVKQRVWKSGDKEVSFRYEFSADKDVPLKQIVARIIVEEEFQDGSILLRHSDGTEGKLPLAAWGPGMQGESGTLVFHPKALGDFTVTIDPPVKIPYDHKIKMELAADRFKAGKIFPHYLSLARCGEPAGQVTQEHGKRDPETRPRRETIPASHDRPAAAMPKPLGTDSTVACGSSASTRATSD